MLACLCCPCAVFALQHFVWSSISRDGDNEGSSTERQMFHVHATLTDFDPSETCAYPAKDSWCALPASELVMRGCLVNSWQTTRELHLEV